MPPPQAQLQLGVHKSMKEPLLSKELPQDQQLRLQLAALTNRLQLQALQRQHQVLLHV